MLPTFHQSYWLGLNASKWPEFVWMDPVAAGSNYTRWGTAQDGEQEPNNRRGRAGGPQELCAAANATLSGGQPLPMVWSDAECGLRLPFMCRQIGNVDMRM